ncbi:hypothetical protein ACA910_014231 [Epithemia clementina (nom. ined.)]
MQTYFLAAGLFWVHVVAALEPREDTAGEYRKDALCSAHSECSHLAGLCCPANQGVYLHCCDESPVADVDDDYKCLDRTFETVQIWDEPIIEPDGSLAAETKDTRKDRGQKWSFVDHIWDKEGKNKVGFGAELRIRINKADKWRTQGTLMDMFGCNGHLSFEGHFSDETRSGRYTILGGTGDFAGATGYISESFEYGSVRGTRSIVVEKSIVDN